jgi:hypothetical protein
MRSRNREFARTRRESLEKASCLLLKGPAWIGSRQALLLGLDTKSDPVEDPIPLALMLLHIYGPNRISNSVSQLEAAYSRFTQVELDVQIALVEKQARDLVAFGECRDELMKKVKFATSQLRDALGDLAGRSR